MSSLPPSHYHSILCVAGGPSSSSHAAGATLASLIRSQLLSSPTLSVAVFVGTPASGDGSKTKVRRILKHGSTIEEALKSLSSLNLSESSGVGEAFRLSSLLRGLLGDVASFSGQEHRIKLSIVFQSSPDVIGDVDLPGALSACVAASADVQLLCLGTSCDAAVAQLSLLASDFAPHVAVTYSEVYNAEEIAFVKSAWVRWACEDSNADAELYLTESDHPVAVQLVALSTEAPTHPEALLACKCHGMLAARPPRCAVSGRKPSTLTTLAGRSFGEHYALLPDKGRMMLRPFAVVPVTALDCSVVLGSPKALISQSELVGALNARLLARGECMLLKCVGRYGTTLYAACPGAAVPLVLLRIAAQEEVLMLGRDGDHSVVSSVAIARIDRVLDRLPHPSTYSPLAYSISTEEVFVGPAAPQATPLHSAKGLIKSVLE